MPSLLILLFALVGLVFLLIFFALYQARSKGSAYGPEELPDSPSLGHGTILCRADKAPTLGREPSFHYDLALRGGNDAYVLEFTSRAKRPWSVRLGFYRQDDFVTGRTSHRDGKVVYGDIDVQGADLLHGYAHGSLLARFNAPLTFSLVGDRVELHNTNNSQGHIDEAGDLGWSGSTLTGTLHHYRHSWLAESTLTITAQDPGLDRSLASLMLVWAADAILNHHHD